jgi:hypothetical protein
MCYPVKSYEPGTDGCTPGFLCYTDPAQARCPNNPHGDSVHVAKIKAITLVLKKNIRG